MGTPLFPRRVDVRAFALTKTLQKTHPLPKPQGWGTRKRNAVDSLGQQPPTTAGAFCGDPPPNQNNQSAFVAKLNATEG
jgi:hypothetical protein